MEIIKAIVMGIKKNLKEKKSQPSTKFAEKDYNLGRDICQKFLFIIMLAGYFLLPTDFAITWIVASVIGGFCVLFPIFIKIFKKKSEMLLSKKDAKRFLSMPSKVWNWTVAIPLSAILIYDLIKNFDYLNIAIHPILFVCIYSILTKNASLAYNRSERAHDPNVVGTKEWVEANGVERVYGMGSDIVYRDKNGNYYSKNTGNYLPIPTPITIRKNK